MYKGLEGLPVFSLKFNLLLFPAFLVLSSTSVSMWMASRKSAAWVQKALHFVAWLGAEKVILEASDWEGCFLLPCLFVVV